jgi:cytoskeletal protein CcmA (bactofilin family)
MFWKKPAPPPPPPEPAVPPAPPPERRFTDRVAQAVTILGPTLRLVGDIQSADSMEIAGSVEGKVSSKGLCHLRETGQISGRLSGTYVIVEGKVEGRISARKKAELRGKAHVQADIHAETVAIADGCFFDGRIHMRGSGGGAQHAFEEKRRPHPP